jgi:tricorn protease
LDRHARGSKAFTEIVDSTRGQIRDYAVATRQLSRVQHAVSPNGSTSVYVWSAADNKVRRVTEGVFNSSNPVWDPQGSYLYFISNREFAPQISNIEFNYAANRDSYLYAMALRKDVKHPFPPESDEVSVAKPAEKPAEGPRGTTQTRGAKTGTNPKPPPTVVDFEASQPGLLVPVGADNYGGLSAKAGHLLMVSGPRSTTAVPAIARRS